MKKAKYNGPLLSPAGDVEAYNEHELSRAFPRKIKASGTTLRAARRLPFHAEKMVGDTPGVSVRHAPKDEVV